MSVYTEESLKKIIVPSLTGNNNLLTDEEYSMLSPKNYRLDNAISSYNKTKSSLLSDLDNFFKDYNKSLKTSVKELGKDFFTLNEKDLGTIDEKEETKKINTVYERIVSDADRNLKIMEEINSRLTEIENILLKMNHNYHERLKEVENAHEKYNDCLNNRPHRMRNELEETYRGKLAEWERRKNSLYKEYSSLEELLKRDIHSTESSINATWICQKNGGN